MDEEELLECNADQVMCPPPAPIPSPSPRQQAADPEPLDAVNDDLLPPPGYGVALDPEPGPHPPQLDLGPPAQRVAPEPEPEPLPLLDQTPTPIAPPYSGPPRNEYERNRAEEERRAHTEPATNRWHPFGDNGPYVELGGGGLNLGIGMDYNDEDVNADSGVHFNLGTWENTDGTEQSGIRFHGNVFPGGSGSVHDDFGARGRGELEGGVGTFDGGVYWDDSTLTIGGQANAAEGAATLGDNPDPQSHSDTSVRVGGSLGEGAAVRFHYGDEDGDQHPEYGVGADAGPLSGDVTSEHDRMASLARNYTNLGQNFNAAFGLDWF